MHLIIIIIIIIILVIQIQWYTPRVCFLNIQTTGLLTDIIGKMLAATDFPGVIPSCISNLQQDGQSAVFKRFAYIDCNNTIISVICSAVNYS